MNTIDEVSTTTSPSVASRPSDHPSFAVSFRLNFAWMAISKAIVMVVAFISGSIIVRSLGPANQGIYAEIQTWVALFTTLFSLSIDSAIYHFANRVRYGTDERSRFITILSLSLIYSLIATLSLIASVVIWTHQFSVKVHDYIGLLIVLLVITMIVNSLTTFFQAMGNIRFSAIIGLVQVVICLGVVGLGYAGNCITVLFAVTNLIVGQVSALVMLIGYSLKSGYALGSFSKDIAKGMILAGAKQHIATISTFVFLRINQLIVLRYSGEAEAGLFAVSLTLASAVLFFSPVFQTVLYPRVIHSEDDYQVTIRSLRLGFYGSGLFIILVILFSKPLILLYAGHHFAQSIVIFRILTVGFWLMSLSSLVAPYYVKSGAFIPASFSAVFLGIISVGLNFALIPRYAGIGAAIATLATCAIGFCFVLTLLWYISKRNPLEFIVFKLS